MPSCSTYPLTKDMSTTLSSSSSYENQFRPTSQMMSVICKLSFPSNQMVGETWRQKAKEALNSLSLKPPLFYLLTTNLLSLLLPLAFLLLARLSSAKLLLALSPRPPLESLPSFFLSLFLVANPFFLYVIVFFVSFATLFYSMTDKLGVLPCFSTSFYRPPLYAAWIFICSLQVCVGLAIEGSIAIGVEASSYGINRGLIIRVLFFFGLHQTMLHWEKMVVKRVVDDAVFGVYKEETWFEKVAMDVSFSSLWCWKLRHDVEALVLIGEAKRSAFMDIGGYDLAGWCLYFLTVVIGIVKVVKVLSWPLCKFFTRAMKTKKSIVEEEV